MPNAPCPVPGPRLPLRALAAALLVLVAPAIAAARGGGGCLEAGTRVATPLGEVPVEALRPGAPVWTVVAGRLQAARVMAVTRVEPEEYVELAAGGAVVRMTAEHPVQIGAGVFRTAERLAPGAPMFLQDGAGVREVRLGSARRVKADRPAYNLLVQPGGTFLANGLLVHNKGCFLPDTPITRADGGQVAIRDVRPGDALLAFTADGEVVATTVREVIEHDVDEYVELTTEHTSLRVTREHPFFVGDGTFETVEALRPGDEIYVLSAAGLAPERIVELRPIHAPVHVYNLRTDHPNTYFAGGVAVHNKGGGGYRSSGGYSSRSSSSYRSSYSSSSRSSSSSSYRPSYPSGGYHSTYSGGSSSTSTTPSSYSTSTSSSGGCDGSSFAGVVVVLFLVGIGWVVWKKYQESNEDLDYSYSRGQIERKSQKTEKLLEFLARVDPAMSPKALRTVAETTFLELQRCWEARDYEPMRPRMMPDLWREHAAQLEGMKRNHEIDRIADLSVDAVDLVNVRYPHKEEQREFTALFTATARDHYVDDRTGSFLRGDESRAQFQEFWTFQRQDGAWRLREIEQTRESDALKDENFFEQFTDMGRDQIYGQEAGKEGPAGPWLEKPVETKATKIERLLAFLVQTDKLWDRQAMLERARQVFLDVTLSREQGDPAAIPEGALFPDVAAALREELARMKARGVRYQFRNLCVRKVELILVRNFTDNARDEYTVRVSAHAQRGVERAGVSVTQDDDVTPFTQYWTFGRLDNAWKLKEILPEARGEEAVRAENLDEDSSPEQVQWYYKQTRAN